jgi:uncharacterized protein
MQSNGLVLTDELLQFVQSYDVHMGISLDGSETIHDAERLTTAQGPTYRKITENIEILHNNGVNVSCLMVLTRNALQENYEFIRYFEKNHIHLKINPLLNYGEAYEHPELSHQPEEYADYLIGLYEYIIKEDIGVTISPTDKILQAILEDDSIHECTFNRECNKHFLCIDHKGDIYPCGKFSDMNLYKLGNVESEPYDVFDSTTMDKFRKRRSEALPEKCRTCKYLKLCNAGCNAEAVIDGNLQEPPLLCADYKKLFRYFHKDGLLILKKELVRQKEMLEETKNEL